MADIFLSYATEDRATAGEVASQLEALGFSVWWDRKIPAGKTWRQVIESALNEMGCMVVLWSSSSLASTWVSEEAEEARMRDRLVPALIEAVLPPLGFRGIQAADLVGWDGSAEAAGFRDLVAGIETLLAPRRGIRPAAAATMNKVGGNRHRSRMLTVGSGCLLLLLTAGTWFWYDRHDPAAALQAPAGDGARPAPAASPRSGTAAPPTAAAPSAQSGTDRATADSASTTRQPATVASVSPASPAPSRDGGAAAVPAKDKGTTAAAGGKPRTASEPAPKPPTEAAAPIASAGTRASPESAGGARSARPARCRDILERQGLGDPVSAEERTYFQKECRT